MTFPQFIVPLSRFPIYSPVGYVKANEVSSLTCSQGTLAVKCYYRAMAIEGTLRKISELITLIVNGPQVEINTQYSIADLLLRQLYAFSQELDPSMPDDYKCAPFVAQAIQQLQQIASYIPTFISASAPSLSQYIQSFVDILAGAIEIIDRIAAVFRCIHPIIQSFITPIDETNEQTNQISAIVHLIELLVIDLTNFSFSEKVKGSETTVQSIELWINTLNQFSNTLFSLVGKAGIEQANAMQQVSSVYPSILDVFGLVKELDPDSPVFVEATYHVIAFVQFVSQVEFPEVYKAALTAASLLSESFTSNSSKSLLQSMKVVFEALSKRTKAALYGTLHADAVAVINSFSQIDINDSRSICLSSALALIIFGLTCGMRSLSCNLLKSIINECFQILSPYCQEFKQEAANASTIISANESVFDTKKLGYMNYYLRMALDSSIPETTAQSLAAVKPFLVSSILLPQKINELAQGTGTEDQFIEFYDKMKDLSINLMKWCYVLELCESNLIISRAELITSISSYAATVLQVQSPAGSLQSSLQNAMKYTRVDISSAMRISANILDASQEIEKLISQQDTAIFAQPLKLLIEEKASPFRVSDLIASDNQADFIGIVSALVNHLFLSISTSTESIEKNAVSFIQHFSSSYSLSLMIFSTIEIYSEFSGALSAYPPTMKGYLDVIWPTAVAISSGQSQDVSALQMYTNALIKTVQEMQNSLASVQQPTQTYEISEELKAVRSLQAANSQLPVALRSKGQKLIAAGISTPGTIPYISPWFKAATQPAIPLQEAANKVINDAQAYREGSKFDSLLWDVVVLMVSLVMTDIHEIVKPCDTLFSQLLDDITSMIHPENVVARVRFIYMRAQQVLHMITYSKVKAVDAPLYITAAISATALHIKKMSEEYNPNSLNIVMSSVSAYNALASLFPAAANDATNFTKYAGMLSTINDAKIATTLSLEVAKLYQQRIKNSFELADLSNDSIIDAMYDFFEDTRYCANAVQRTLTQGDAPDEYLNSIIRQFISSTASVLFLTSKAVTNNPEAVIDGAIDIANSLPLIVAGALVDHSEKSVLGFRRGNRNVSKHIDTFINLVESPQEVEKKDSFNKLKENMLNQLVAVFVECMKKLAYSSVSLFQDIIINTSASYAQAEKKFTAAFEEVKSKAVGKTKKTFIDLYIQLINSLQAFSATTCNYSTSFPPLPIIESISRVASSVQRFSTATEHATNILIIDPDPIAAKSVPEFTPNFNLTTTLTTADALSELINANADLKTQLNAFDEIFSNDSASSDELLEQAKALAKTCDSITRSAIIMSAATTDKASKVEQQTNAHALAQAASAVLTAVKSRLMRTPTFEAEMKEARAQLIDTAAKSAQLGDTASKIVVQDDANEAEDAATEGDEVSSELQATASAISDMSSRLAQFSAKLDVSIDIEGIDDVPDDIPEEDEAEAEEVPLTDIKAEEGSMAAYIIACATPIMQTAGEILERSQVICREMRGKITNEAFIIKCAHDTTEAAQLLIIAAEIAIEGKESDPEFIAIAASNMVRTAIAGLVAQVLQQSGDPEGKMMRLVKTVRFYSLKINRKVEAIARQKWNAANPVKATGNKIILKMNAGSKLNQYQQELDDAERARKAFRRKG